MQIILRKLLIPVLAGMVAGPVIAGTAVAEETEVTEEKPVSFASDVAPILVDQCLACHNARTARGRFSVQSFSALMNGGESGEAVTPGDGDFSNLVLLVESGEMPKDGDPLPAGQIAILKRWIEDGAALDEGRSPDAPLRSIMPRPDHPTPPEVYPAPVPVTALAFDRDGGRLAVSGYHEVLVFHAEDGRLLQRIGNVAERIHGLDFSPDGTLLAIAAGTPGRFGEVTLVQMKDGKLAAELALAADAFLDVAFSPDGNKVAAAGADRTIRVWNTADGTEILRAEGHADWVTAIAFSPDGQRIATASRDKTSKVLELPSGSPLVTFAAHQEPVHDVAFSGDGKLVATCGSDRRIRFWDASSGKQTKSSGLGGEGLSLVRFDDNSLVCGTSGRTMRRFGFDGEQQSLHDGFPDWPTALAVTPDGSLLAIGTADGQVSIRTNDESRDVRTLRAMPPTP